MSDKSKTEIGCEGCSMFEHCLMRSISDIEKIYDKIKNCPCRICLVKVLCDESCLKYETWLRNCPSKSVIMNGLPGFLLKVYNIK